MATSRGLLPPLLLLLLLLQQSKLFLRGLQL